MSDQVRMLRNRCLRAVRENNWSVMQDALRKLTPSEIRQLRDDAAKLHATLGTYLHEMPDVMKVSDRDE